MVAGRTETASTTSARRRTAVGADRDHAATTPDVAGLSARALCTVTNFTLAARTARARRSRRCRPSRRRSLKTTAAGYDVVDKSITQLGADMASGLTTSQAITRAYLDRIAAYDQGQFGFHAFITVAKDAMAQAAAADASARAGVKGDLLGVPVIIKDLYDTKDMPTTDGTLAFEGWQPKRDAGQVKRLRDAGAVILGKGNLSEFANSGSYSESGYGMVWNAFKPSKTSLGSSGGSAVAVATSLAGFGMGSQTGVVALRAARPARPSSPCAAPTASPPARASCRSRGCRTSPARSRARRATSPASSTPRPAPTRTTSRTVHADADAKRPADWKVALDRNALQGKRIGYLPASFTGSPSYGQADGTVEAVMATLRRHPGRGRDDGRADHEPAERPERSDAVGQPLRGGLAAVLRPAREPAVHDGERASSARRRCSRTTARRCPSRARLTPQDNQTIMVNRDEYKARIKTWMDTNNVDAVVYPGFRSDVYDNDGAQTLSSDRNSGVLTSNVGLPTLVLPIGANPHGDPISIQFVGRAFDDAKMLGFGYALEQQLGGAGHLAPATAPPLTFAKDTPATIGGTVPATLALDARRAGHVRRVHAGRGQGVHGDDDRQRDLHRR